MLRGERALPDSGCRADHDADTGRARLLSSPGRDPPRHQAREHLPAGRRLGEGRRLRHRPHRGVEPHAGGIGAGDAELHVARADHGAARGRTVGPVLRRRHPLPVPHRRAAVLRFSHDDHAEGAEGRSAAAVVDQHPGAAGDGRRRAQGARQERGRALSDGAGILRRGKRRGLDVEVGCRSGACGQRRCDRHRAVRRGGDEGGCRDGHGAFTGPRGPVDACGAFRAACARQDRAGRRPCASFCDDPRRRRRRRRTGGRRVVRLSTVRDRRDEHGAGPRHDRTVGRAGAPRHRAGVGRRDRQCRRRHAQGSRRSG